MHMDPEELECRSLDDHMYYFIHSEGEGVREGVREGV